MHLRCFVVLLSALGASAAGNGIAVVSQMLSLGETHTLTVEPTLEYIIKFVPSDGDSAAAPLRVWLRAAGGDAARPLLLTARQLTGAVTWQLPYVEQTALTYEMERTLCPAGAADDEPSDCVGAGTGSGARTEEPGALTLHVSSACAARVRLQLRVERAAHWRLQGRLPVSAALAAPHVAFYEWAEGQERVRLVVSSGDDVCATVAVQAYACPILQSLGDISLSVPRMTILRSGGYYIERHRYPRGFYVVILVPENDLECRPEEAEAQDWLWDSLWEPDDDAAPRHERARLKTLTLEIKAGLSRREYWVGAAVTLSVFLAFYVVFGALVLAERWPRWYNLVAPRAVLLPPAAAESGATELESVADEAEARRRRRGSTATFDSSDGSDSDSADEEPSSSPGAARGPAGAGGVAGQVAAGAGALASVGAASPATTGVGAVGGAGQVAEGTAGAAGEGEGAAPSNGRVPADEAVSTDAARDAQGEIASGEVTAVSDTLQRPFGLPARLRVAALARRRARVLAARSQRYLYTLYTVAVFYALPVLQFVISFQVILNVGGSLDLCFYNWLCAHPLGALSDFNHVLSNLGYLLLGALYMLQLRRRRRRRQRLPRDEEQYGLPAHYGLSAALGASLMVVGLLSASYHVCPNRLNFQFDTAFMYVLAVLVMVKVYQARHPDIAARAHSTFGVLALIIALVVWGVLGGGPLFWAVFSVLHVFTFLLLSLRIYYVGQFRLEKASLAAAAASLGGGARPLYTARLLALLLANAVNWAFAIYGLVTQPANIASHLLFVLLCNALLHMVYYLSMKLLHGERPRWYAWLYLGGAAAAWAPALYFFVSASSDWAASPAQSRLLNHECRVLRFYDSHDLWHMLSATALYLTLNALLTWDDGLAAVKRTDIAVF